MSTNNTELINETNLSHAWGRAFLSAMAKPGSNPSPILLSLTGFVDSVPPENPQIRQAVDVLLEANDLSTCEIGAMLIFPLKAWDRHGRPGCEDFSRWYLAKMLPRLRARSTANRNGVYFERMIDYHGERDGQPFVINQLSEISRIWRRDQANGRRPRQSALVVSCLDPGKDLRGQPQRGFPCLQQVSFNYDDAGGLAISAYYPTQHVFDRGYGNYLGLCRLGLFMAHELGLELVRFNCFVGRAELGYALNKQDLRGIEQLVRAALPQQ